MFLSYLLKFFQNNYSVELLPIVFSVKKEEVTQKCSVTKVFLKISQNSQKNTCARVSFLIKLQALVCTFINNRLWHRCFLVNFDKLLRAPFFIEHLQWLLSYSPYWTFSKNCCYENFWNSSCGSRSANTSTTYIRPRRTYCLEYHVFCGTD